MKLALYLPNFRNHVTVQELADLTDVCLLYTSICV